MINVNLIGKALTGSYGDKTFGVTYTPEKYKKMLELSQAAANAATMEELKEILSDFELLTKESRKEVIETKNPHIYVNENTGKYYLKTSSGVISSVPMPLSLVNRINESFDKGIDFEPLIKMWTRFLRNPKAKSPFFAERFVNYVNLMYTNPKQRDELVTKEGLSFEKATELATVYELKITQEGLLNGYKVSQEILVKYVPNEDGSAAVQKPRYQKTFDPNTGEITSEGIPDFVEDRVFQPAIMGTSGDKFYCGEDLGHIIRVGQLHRLPDWSYVNCNDNQSCVKGLHVGGLNYIKNISGEIHNVFIDPMHIGAIPDDKVGAMRVLQYFVHSSMTGVNRGLYHSSSYAKLTDSQWEEMRAQIIKDLGTLSETQQKDNEKIKEQVNAL